MSMLGNSSGLVVVELVAPVVLVELLVAPMVLEVGDVLLVSGNVVSVAGARVESVELIVLVLLGSVDVELLGDVIVVLE